MCFVWISEQTATVSVYSSEWIYNKQSQLMHNIIAYLLIFFVHLLPDMFRQVTMPLSLTSSVKIFLEDFNILEVLTFYIHIHAYLMWFDTAALINGIVTCRNMSGRNWTKKINK
jgi:hypothetical protein